MTAPIVDGYQWLNHRYVLDPCAVLMFEGDLTVTFEDYTAIMNAGCRVQTTGTLTVTAGDETIH